MNCADLNVLNANTNLAYETITSFSEIPIVNKTLVICDIDDTLIKSKKDLEHFISVVKSDYNLIKIEYPFFEDSKEPTFKELLSEAWDMQQIHNQVFGFEHTDNDGFNKMTELVAQTNSKIIFLTARHKLSEEFTRKNFNQIGLDYENYQV